MKKKVLLIDDSAQILVTYRDVLEEINLQVDTAQTREDVLRKTRGTHYDLVLVDLEMPNDWDDKTVATGLNLISELKKLHGDWTVAVLSSYSDRSFIAEAYRLGVDDYIPKGKMSSLDFQQKIRDLLDLNTLPSFHIDYELNQQEKERIRRKLISLSDQIATLNEQIDRLGAPIEPNIKIQQFQEKVSDLEQKREVFKALLPLEVFLCYSPNDSAIVYELYDRLRRLAWVHVWMDKENLLAGQNKEIEIEKAIRNADVVIVSVSRSWTTKQASIHREIRLVLDFALNMPEDAIFVIPLRVEDCELPLRLQHLKSVDYFETGKEQAYERLLASLSVRASALGISTLLD
jgi:DNA-binding NarL/FixJ family response regulator